MAETWTIQRVLTWTSDYFTKKGIDSPRLTAELLLGFVLACDRVRLYVDFDRPLNADELAKLRGLIERRVAGEPTHYLLGRREFFGRSFRVDARVLIPRPETELLVEECLARLAPDTSGPVLDACTGSGCIAVTLAAERPELQVVATDLSEGALEVARANAEDHGVAGRVELLRGDLLAPAHGRSFALVVSNPPYVPAATIPTLSPEVRREPRGALDGGPDGLDLVRRLVSGSPALLAPGGSLLMEIGEGQGAAVLAMFASAGFVDGVIRNDLAGLERIALARRP